MTDLHGSTAGSLGASTKGLQRRQKMQTELAAQSSNFFLQLHQQIRRKMFPAKMVPTKEEDLLAGHASMCMYLERFGNFKQSREVGLTMWVLAHAIDSFAQGDFRTCQEFLALLALALEQVTVDGDWRLAYHLTLLEEPPAVMFQHRPLPVSAVGKPFADLVPPALAATALAYIKLLCDPVDLQLGLRRGLPTPLCHASLGFNDDVPPPPHVHSECLFPFCGLQKGRLQEPQDHAPHKEGEG